MPPAYEELDVSRLPSGLTGTNAVFTGTENPPPYTEEAVLPPAYSAQDELQQPREAWSGDQEEQTQSEARSQTHNEARGQTENEAH